MKNFLKLLGNPNRTCRRQVKVPLLIAALVAIIGFSMTACSNPTEPPSSGTGSVAAPGPGTVISGTLGGGGGSRAVDPGDGQKFRGEVQSNNSIIGKLEDGAL